jgi:hypothetical protein
MSRAKKGISERAVERLEEKGYLMSVRAEMKAEVMKCLVEMEEAGEIPPHLRIKRYTPPDEPNQQALGYVLEFLRFHGLTNTAECLIREVNAEIEPLGNAEPALSLVAQSIREKAPEVDDSIPL